MNKLQAAIERAIEVVAPMRAVQRAQARIALDSVRAYDAAKVGRRTGTWNPGGASANAEIGPAFTRVRNRARDMVRNNELACSAVRHKATGLIGTGIAVQPALKSEANVWKAWANSKDCDADGQNNLAGLFKLIIRTKTEAGEVLVRRRWRRASDGYVVPMQLQVLEPDHLDSYRNGPEPNGNLTILGVEFDKLGTRVAYWIFPTHPGENVLIQSIQSVRVPASEIIHLYNKDRPSQVRGISELGVGLMRLLDIRDFEEAVRLKKKIEACFTAFVTTENPNLTIGGASLDPSDTDQPRKERISPASITYLKQGETVNFGTPPASSGEDTFLLSQQRMLAAGWGIPYELLTGDLSRLNFTSIRAGMIEYRMELEQEQWLLLVPWLIDPVRQWFRDACVVAGKPIGSKPDNITMPKKPWVRPSEDVAAAKEEIRGGLSTMGEAVRERGWATFEDFVAEAKREAEMLKAAGLTFDTSAPAPPAPTAAVNPLDASQ